MITLKNISYSVSDEKTGGETTILHDINLEFPDKGITVITGHNGSGKSTLVKLIMGILQPSGGKIFFDGTDITDMPINDRANLGLTLALQQPVRFKGLTVKQVLDVATKADNLVLDACDCLSRVGLCARDYLNRELSGSLSGGELKRIELAISLAKGGQVFIFDEPEAGIDLWSFDSLIEIFKKLKDKTVIIVSHQKKILDIADKIVLLDRNTLPKVGVGADIMPLISSNRCDVLEGKNE